MLSKVPFPTQRQNLKKRLRKLRMWLQISFASYFVNESPCIKGVFETCTMCMRLTSFVSNPREQPFLRQAERYEEQARQASTGGCWSGIAVLCCPRISAGASNSASLSANCSRFSPQAWSDGISCIRRRFKLCWQRSFEGSEIHCLVAPPERGGKHTVQEY